LARVQIVWVLMHIQFDGLVTDDVKEWLSTRAVFNAQCVLFCSYSPAILSHAFKTCHVAVRKRGNALTAADMPAVSAAKGWRQRGIGSIMRCAHSCCHAFSNSLASSALSPKTCALQVQRTGSAASPVVQVISGTHKAINGWKLAFKRQAQQPGSSHK
jgi:hypothetical protein